MKGSLDELTEQYCFTKHVLRTGQGVVIPSGIPHLVHTVPNTIALNICLEEKLTAPTAPTDSVDQVSCDISPECSPSSIKNVLPVADFNSKSDNYFGISLQDSAAPVMQNSLTLSVRPGGTKSRRIRHYFEVVRSSNLLRQKNLTARRKLEERPKTVGYIECTHFVAGTLKRDCKGATIAYRVGNHSNAWHLGWIHSLTYHTTSKDRSADGTLGVFRWIGTTAVCGEGSIHPSMFHRSRKNLTLLENMKPVCMDKVEDLLASHSACKIGNMCLVCAPNAKHFMTHIFVGQDLPEVSVLMAHTIDLNLNIGFGSVSHSDVQEYFPSSVSFVDMSFCAQLPSGTDAEHVWKVFRTKGLYPVRESIMSTGSVSFIGLKRGTSLSAPSPSEGPGMRSRSTHFRRYIDSRYLPSVLNQVIDFPIKPAVVACIFSDV